MTNAAPGSEVTPAPRRRLTPAQRRAQLVAVGVEVFTARGYQGASLEDIAVSAGVTRPLIYHYFHDKDELYREIVRDARAELDAALVTAVAGVQGPAEQLRAGLRAYFTFVRDRGPQWELLFGGGTAIAGAVASDAAVLRFRTAEQIAVLVQQAVPQLDVTAAGAYAHAISGAAEQLAKWWRRHPEVPVERIVQLHLDTVWTGLERLSVGVVGSGGEQAPEPVPAAGDD